MAVGLTESRGKGAPMIEGRLQARNFIGSSEDVIPVEMGVEQANIEVSIVMPCLNEAETLETCIRKAQKFLQSHAVKGEIVVADNGSTDGSQTIAVQAGARLVNVETKGYGAALLGGIAAARGKFVVMGDSDDSYDFANLAPFLDKLREDYDLVMGNRFKGGIEPGAMPFLHQYLGNPVLSGIGRLFFRAPIGDFHCGLRGFKKSSVQGLDLQTTGMEFASEMVVKASLNGLRVTEVPTTLSPDGRSRPPHLRSWRDGWRHLRFMLLYSPTHLFIWPGGILGLLGALIMGVLAAGPVDLGSLFFGFHWMFVGSLLTLIGFQIINLGLIARFYSLTSHLDQKRDRIIEWIQHRFKLEAGILLGGGMFCLGILLDLLVLLSWLSGNFQSSVAVRLSILALTFSIIGVQVLFSAFFLSIMAIKRRPEGNQR